MPLPGDGTIKCRYVDCEVLFHKFQEREEHYIKVHSNRYKLERYDLEGED